MGLWSSFKVKFLCAAVLCGLLGVLAYMVIVPALTSDADPSSAESSSRDLARTYKQVTKNNHTIFTHKSAGYQLHLPGEPEIHFDSHQLSTDFRWDNKRLRVYTQRASNGISPRDIVAYSTGNVDDDFSYRTNSENHRVSVAQPVWINAQPAFLTIWERTPLKHLPNDMPYYCTIDIIPGDNTAATLLFTSSTPFDDVTPEMTIARSYQNKRVTKDPYIRIQGNRDTAHRTLTPGTRALYDTYFSPEAPLSWGIFEPTYSAFDYQTLQALETRLHYTFPFIVHYMDFTRSEPHTHVAPILEQAAQEGRCVELTLQTVDEPNGPSQVYDVLNGRYDDYLHNLAAVIHDSGGPVLMRIGNEMNGDWCDYCAYHLSRDADIYIAFYRYIHDFLEKEGVGDQLLYVWNPNNQSYPDFNWNQPALYYPGDDYVDILGMTAYNTGTYYPSEQWLAFSDLYDETWEIMTNDYRQPVMITEFACSSIGGDKPAWTAQALDHMSTYTDLKVAIWWNHADYDPDHPTTISRPYYLTDPPAMVPLFRDYLQSFPKTLTIEEKN